MSLKMYPGFFASVMCCIDVMLLQAQGKISG